MSLDLIVWALLGMVAAASADGHVPPEGSKFSYCCGTALYKLTIKGLWEGDLQDGDVPDNGTFSPFTIASHTEHYTMWRPNMKASSGVKEVAETGKNDILVAELETYKEHEEVYDIVTTGPVGPQETGHVYVKTNTEFHLVSTISMIFPSPDWFIGLYNIDLCVSDTAKWIGNRTINLYAWDAGTDSGKNFTAQDWPTDPAEDISLIMNVADPESSFPLPDDHSDPMYKYVHKFAEAHIQLVNITDCDRPECEALGTQTYHVTFQGSWSENNHPNTDLPSDASFSPLVVAGHSMDYSMWKPGGMASPGVEKVAEEGPPTLLQEELNAVKKGVLDHMTAAGPVRSNETMQTYVELDKDHPYISAISMIFPSPDWFVGVSSVDLCDGYFWKNGPITFRLLPWDAGTEEGMQFNTTNDANDPHETISLITTDTMGPFYNRARQHIPAMGTITLERKRDDQTDYKNVLQTWKNAFNNYQEEFEQWKENECPVRD